MYVDTENSSCCPADDDLVAFSVGAIADRELEQFAFHLEECVGCTERLRQVALQPDALISTLRGTDFSTPTSEEPECAAQSVGQSDPRRPI